MAFRRAESRKAPDEFVPQFDCPPLNQAADAQPVLPPTIEGARALYPTLDTGELRPGSLPPVVPLQRSDIGAAPEQPTSPLVPGPAGQRPKVVEANPARVFIEIAKRAGGLLRREEPTPVPPIPAPSPAPSPEPPRLPPTPDKPPELPKTEGFVPPDLKDILKPVPGGGFTIPPGGLIALPGTLPDDIPGILVLTAEMLHGEQKGGVVGKVSRVEYTAGEEKGEKTHCGQKGRPRVDIHHDIGDGEARIYEVKTGSAREKEVRIHRLFKDTFFGKIERATVTEIWVPRRLLPTSSGSRSSCASAIRGGSSSSA